MQLNMGNGKRKFVLKVWHLVCRDL
jgi:Na+/melibiose symporter and related transporters